MYFLAIDSGRHIAGPNGRGFSRSLDQLIASFHGVRYFGAIRSAPSNRITEPFMKVFSAI